MLDYLGVLTILHLLCVGGLPTGCSLTGTTLECDFSIWTPPFSSGDFGSMPCSFTFTNVNGTFPANAFGDVTTCGSGTKTVKLQCSGSNLTIENGAFNGNLSAVTTLSIDSCNFESGTLVDNALSPLTGVTTLQVTTSTAGNKLSITDNTLTGMTSITTISTTFVTIGTIPKKFFSPATSVTTISMKGCYITSIEAGAFEGLTSLTLLDFANNQLTTLSDGIFNPLQSLTNLGLGNNQWECTCGLSWFETWVTATGVTLDVSPIQCVGPAAYAGVKLAQAMYALNCYTTTTTTTTAATPASEDWGSVPNILTYLALFIAMVAAVMVIIIIVKLYCLNSDAATLTYNISTNKTQPANNKKINRSSVKPYAPQGNYNKSVTHLRTNDKAPSRISMDF